MSGKDFKINWELLQEATDRQKMNNKVKINWEFVKEFSDRVKAMKKPEKPIPPDNYIPESETKTIFCKNFTTNEDYDENNLLDWKDENDWQEGDPLPNFTILNYRNQICSLADLLNLVSKDIPLENVVITLNRDRYLTELDVSVSFEEKLDQVALKKEYKKLYKEYEAKLKLYESDLVI